MHRLFVKREKMKFEEIKILLKHYFMGCDN